MDADFKYVSRDKRAKPDKAARKFRFPCLLLPTAFDFDFEIVEALAIGSGHHVAVEEDEQSVKAILLIIFVLEHDIAGQIVALIHTLDLLLEVVRA